MHKFLTQIVWLVCGLSLAVPPLQAAQTCLQDVAPVTPTSEFTLHGDGTVTHSRTGLVWDRCPWGQSGTNCEQGSADTYTWEQAQQQAVIANQQAYKGYTDWRVPTKRELASIVEYQCYLPAINETIFPAIASSGFWSSSPYAIRSDSAWGVVFHEGYVYTDDKSWTLGMRLVRGGWALVSLPDEVPQSCNNGTTSLTAEFNIHVDGTTTHSRTGLMWDRCAWGQQGMDCSTGNAGGHTWAEALQIVEIANQQDYKGYRDWRLPTPYELHTLTEDVCDNPAINTTAFPSAIPWRFLSSSPHAQNSDYVWNVDFFTGDIYYGYGESGGWGVRLVRDRQDLTSFPAAAFTFTPDNQRPPVYVTFNAAATQAGTYDIAGYAWNIANTTYSGVMVGHNFTAAGEYPVILTVTDTEGNTDSVTQTVTVQDSPPTVYRLNLSKIGDGTGTVSAPGITCGTDCSEDYAQAQSVALNAVPAAGSRFAGWSGAADCADGVVTVNAEIYCSAAFVLNQLPQAAFTATPLSGEPPLYVSLDAGTAYDPDGDIADYRWTSSDGQTATGRTAGLTFTTPGSYTVTLTVTDNDGGQAQSQQMIVVENPAACVTVSPALRDFGTVVPGQVSSAQIFTFRNTCPNQSVAINTVALGGAQPGEFTLGSNACIQANLAYQQTCTVQLAFAPRGDGAKTATLMVFSGAANTEAPLSGIGGAEPPVACIETPIATNGLSVTLNNACSTDSDGTITRRDWQVSCTNNAAQSRPNGSVTETFQFTAPGTCTATLTVTDNDGNTDSVSEPFELNYTIRPVNLSVRCHIQPSPKTAVAGFIIEGTGSKKILLRALAVASMSPGLDLRLSLYKLLNGTWTEILGNDNWASGSRAAEIAGLAVNLVPAGSMDAALLVDLEPGAYTAIATPNGAGGIGVVGVEDLDGDSPSCRLINISGRCAVEDGTGNAIAGFIVAGDGTLKTLLRGLRVNDELSGTLDPRLELVRIYPGNPVAEVLENNDNRDDHPRLAEINVLAENLRPRDHRDGVILRELSAGVYTVLMKPNGVHGVGVVGVDALE